MPSLSSLLIGLASYLPPQFSDTTIDEGKEAAYQTLCTTTNPPDIYTDPDTLKLDSDCTYTSVLKDAIWNKNKNEMNLTVLYEGNSVPVLITESYFKVGIFTYNIQANLLGRTFDNIKIKKIKTDHNGFCISARLSWLNKDMEVSYAELCSVLLKLLEGEPIVVFDDITSLHLDDAK